MARGSRRGSVRGTVRTWQFDRSTLADVAAGDSAVIRVDPPEHHRDATLLTTHLAVGVSPTAGEAVHRYEWVVAGMMAFETINAPTDLPRFDVPASFPIFHYHPPIVADVTSNESIAIASSYLAFEGQFRAMRKTDENQRQLILRFFNESTQSLTFYPRIRTLWLLR